MSGYRPATDPTQRMADLHKLGYEKPAEIVGHLAATEDALFAALDLIGDLTQFPPKLDVLLRCQRAVAGPGPRAPSCLPARSSTAVGTSSRSASCIASFDMAR